MFFLFLFRWSCYFFFCFVCSVVVLHLVLWWFFPLLVFAFYMHPPCMRVALACSTIPWSYTFHVSIDYDGGRKLRERERGGSGSEGEERRVEGRKERGEEMGRRWKQVRRKRRECRHIYPGRTVRYLATGPLFLAAAGIYFSANYFFLLASGFLFFFGARVRVE